MSTSQLYKHRSSDRFNWSSMRACPWPIIPKKGADIPQMTSTFHKGLFTFNKAGMPLHWASPLTGHAPLNLGTGSDLLLSL